MRKFEVVDATGSTNTDLLGRLFVEPDPQQLPVGQGLPPNEQVLLAWHQTAGRGQRGRQWHSNTQQSLTFSMSLDGNANQIKLEGFSLFVGLCVVEGIERWWQSWLADFANRTIAQQPAPVKAEQLLSRDLKLKWPNDVVVNSEQGLLKIGGLLVETRAQGSQMRLVVGVGVNVFGDFTSTETRLASPTSAVQALSPLSPTLTAFTPTALTPTALLPNIGQNFSTAESQSLRKQLAINISEVFFSHWPVFAGRGFAAYQKAYQAQHVLHNKAVQWFENDQWQLGVCTGVAADGALLVKTETNVVRPLYSSSVSVRLRETGNLNSL
jgi:BirA family transcriptional regulator, biotin operon repressor / biotin---[acetyl-CoA-carboxylase] ligase